MKRKILNAVTFFCVLLISACKIHSRRPHPDRSLVDSKNSFYFVDTIQYNDPVRIWSKKYNGFFIVEREKLKSFRNDRTFFNQDDVILLGTDLYMDLPKIFFLENKFSWTLKESSYSDSKLKIEGLEVSEFENKPKYFLVALVSDNYYYLKHNAENQFSYLNNNFNVVYFRLAYAIAE